MESLISFFIGMCVGTFFGIIIASLMAVSRKGDDIE